MKILRSATRLRNLLAIFLLILGIGASLNNSAQTPTERDIAARFAPVFHQALGDTPRSDYITNFDFDGDWRGDNNWANADNKRFPLRANIYYSVSETTTHYFIHYAVFHPRDYKGGTDTGRLLSELLLKSSKIVGKRDPTGLLDEATAAHENDLEGALVVVAKNGEGIENARVQFVETLQHNAFRRYAVGEKLLPGTTQIRSEGDSVLLYVEPKGHGIEAYTGEGAQMREKQIIVYRFTGKADDPEEAKSSTVGYELLPISTTLWPKARFVKGKKNQTFANPHNYATISIRLEQKNGRRVVKKVKVGSLGSAFLGSTGGINMARPPWGWFDMNRRTDPLGQWFFDPAITIKRDFEQGETFSTTYTQLPFWATK